MIIEKARELGIALSESAEFKRMLSTRTALDESETVTKMMEEYKADQERLMHVLESDSAESSAEARVLSDNMDRLQAEMLSLPEFTEAMAAQNEFQQLLNRVHHTIGVCIGMEDPEYKGGGCSGSCSSCSGCH